MARRSRYSHDEDEGARIFAGLAGLLVLFVGSLWYTNRVAFYEWIVGLVIFGAIILTLIFFSIRFFRKKKAERQNALISQIESFGKEAAIQNFINKFRYDKGKVWSYLGYSFTWARLHFLANELKDSGVKLKNNNELKDVSFILRHYIAEKEEKITRTGITANVQQEFEKLPRSGTDFELLLVRLYEAMGYTVEHIGKSGDQGGDLIAEKQGERILIQAKQYMTWTPGNAAVQQAVAAMKMYGCNKSAVISTADGFTKEAVQLAQANNTELISKERLREMLLEYLHENWI